MSLHYLSLPTTYYSQVALQYSPAKTANAVVATAPAKSANALWLDVGRFRTNPAGDPTNEPQASAGDDDDGHKRVLQKH